MKARRWDEDASGARAGRARDVADDAAGARRGFARDAASASRRRDGIARRG